MQHGCRAGPDDEVVIDKMFIKLVYRLSLGSRNIRVSSHIMNNGVDDRARRPHGYPSYLAVHRGFRFLARDEMIRQYEMRKLPAILQQSIEVGVMQ